RTYGLVFSQRLLLMLIDTGLSREAAYDLVQPLAMKAWRERTSFREIVEANEAVRQHLNLGQIGEAFDPAYHLREVDTIFGRIGL
ncbi:MAG: adenylosuccinate lyase, partial [Bacteroidota bacterium]